MANFNNSVLPGAIRQVKKEFQAIEDRMQEYGGIRAFLNSSNSFPEIARLGSSFQKPASWEFRQNTPSTGADALSCNPVGVSGDTQDTALVWQTVTGEMTISDKRASENRLSVEQMAATDLRNMWTGIYNNLETKAIAHLNSNRSQNSIALAGMSTWQAAADFYNLVILDNEDRLRSFMNSEMRKAKYTGLKDVIMSAPYDEQFLHTEIQGKGNAENVSDQDRYFKYHYTNADIEVSSTKGGIFVVPVGGIAMLVWIDDMYKKKRDAGDKLWSSTKDPMFGIEFGTYRKVDCGDTTLIGGAEQDFVESLQVSMQVAFTNATTTTPANETPIHKYAVASS